LIGSLELLPEAMGLDEPCALLVVIKPGTQGFPDRGVARCGALPRRGLPIEHAIEALEEVGRQADTDDPRLVLGAFGHGLPLLLKKHYRMEYMSRFQREKRALPSGDFPREDPVSLSSHWWQGCRGGVCLTAQAARCGVTKCFIDPGLGFY